MTEKEKATQFGITPHDATLFVSQCENVDENELKTFLSRHIVEMEKALESCNEEAVERYIRVIKKGLRERSRQVDALRYFYYGYYVCQQEELLKQQKNQKKASEITVLLSKKHYANVLTYLFKNGCARQKAISESLGINRSNLNRLMNNLIECNMVVKSVGPKCAFYELSPAGYAFVREHLLITNR